MNSEHTLNPTGGVLNRRYMEEPTSSLNLLECILSSDNGKEAWKQVRTNKGAPGIDGITVSMNRKVKWLQWKNAVSWSLSSSGAKSGGVRNPFKSLKGKYAC